MNRLAWATFVLGACVSARLLADAPVGQQQVPVFRSGTTVVPLTVTVLDKAGRPITDLKLSEFVVTEDGKAREIVSFFPQPFSARPATPMRAVSQTPWSPTVAPKTSRTFLFVLGPDRIQYPTKAVDGMMNLVRDKLLPQDAVGVLAFNRATDFTTDHERIIQMLERYKRGHERIVFEVNEFRHRNLRYAPQPASTQAEIDALFRGTDDPFRRATDLLLGLDRPSQNREQRADLRLNLVDVQEEATTRGIGLSDLILETGVLKVYAGIEYLREMDGEKHLVFLGSGLELLSVEDERRMARRASDARVTVDIIKTSGVVEVALAALGRIQSLQNVSALTGGIYTGVSMADKALGAIDRSSRFSYLIGYEPVKVELDGAFRDVLVTVTRPGATVLYRHGYFAAEQPDPADLNDAVAQARVESAIRVGEASTDIALTATAVLIRPGPKQEVVVDIVVDASRLVFKPNGDDMATVNVVLGIYCRNAKDQTVGMLIGRLTATVDRDRHRDYLEQGIPYSVRMPAPGIPYSVKVVASDYGSALVGTVVARVRNR